MGFLRLDYLIKINSLAVTNKFVRQGCKKIAESVFTLKY